MQQFHSALIHWGVCCCFQVSKSSALRFHHSLCILLILLPSHWVYGTQINFKDRSWSISFICHLAFGSLPTPACITCFLEKPVCTSSHTLDIYIYIHTQIYVCVSAQIGSPYLKSFLLFQSKTRARIKFPSCCQSCPSCPASISCHSIIPGLRRHLEHGLSFLLFSFSL